MLECPLNYAVRLVYVTYGAMFIDCDDTINMPITLFILQENKYRTTTIVQFLSLQTRIGLRELETVGWLLIKIGVYDLFVALICPTKRWQIISKISLNTV